jgi:hypothetical protein
MSIRLSIIDALSVDDRRCNIYADVPTFYLIRMAR